jgi:hypothetical protein
MPSTGVKIASTELPNVFAYRYSRPALAKHFSTRFV